MQSTYSSVLSVEKMLLGPLEQASFPVINPYNLHRCLIIVVFFSFCRLHVYTVHYKHETNNRYLWFI